MRCWRTQGIRYRQFTPPDLLFPMPHRTSFTDLKTRETLSRNTHRGSATTRSSHTKGSPPPHSGHAGAKYPRSPGCRCPHRRRRRSQNYPLRRSATAPVPPAPAQGFAPSAPQRAHARARAGRRWKGGKRCHRHGLAIPSPSQSLSLCTHICLSLSFTHTHAHTYIHTHRSHPYLGQYGGRGAGIVLAHNG